MEIIEERIEEYLDKCDNDKFFDIQDFLNQESDINEHTLLDMFKKYNIKVVADILTNINNQIQKYYSFDEVINLGKQGKDLVMALEESEPDTRLAKWNDKLGTYKILTNGDVHDNLLMTLVKHSV